MTGNPARQYERYPTRAAADNWYDHTIALAGKHADANNTLYQYDASSDYNPAPELEKIRAKLLLVVFADDQINSPEFAALDHEMPRVKHGRFAIVPATQKSNGEGNNTVAEFWQQYLREVLTSVAH